MDNMDKLNKILKKLQQVMRIQDWDIVLEVIDKHKMKDLGEDKDYSTNGLHISYLTHNEAFIYLNKDSEYTQKNWYLVLVHELFHVLTARHRYLSDRFEDKDLTDLLNVENESMVEHLAKIFVSIYPQYKIEEVITDGKK